MVTRHQPRCVQCSRFVPGSWVSVMAVGDCGGWPCEDEAECAEHGGPNWDSAAARASTNDSGEGQADG